MTTGPYQERRAPSGRFLPPDPRVREPHRLTPQLALRVAILGVVALAAFGVLFLRLWSLQVLSGDDYLNAAQSNQLRLVRVEAPRGPAPRPPRTRGRLERRGDRRRALGRRHAEGGPVRARPASRERPRRARAPARTRGGGAPLRSADADRREDRRGRGAGRLPLRAPGGVPGCRDRPDLPPRLSVLVARGADPRLHGRDLAGGAEAAPQAWLPVGRPGREDRNRGRVRLVPARQGRPRRDSRRLARPAGEPVRAAPRAAARVRDPTDARHAASARGRAGAAVRHRPRAPERPVGGGRRRDRRARPARRRRPRDGVGSDVQAVRVRRTDRSEEALGALLRLEQPAVQPRDRRPLPARLDVEAGHRARGDAGARVLRVRVDPVHAGRRRTGSTSSDSGTGTRSSTAR